MDQVQHQSSSRIHVRLHLDSRLAVRHVTGRKSCYKKHGNSVTRRLRRGNGNRLSKLATSRLWTLSQAMEKLRNDVAGQARPRTAGARVTLLHLSRTPEDWTTTGITPDLGASCQVFRESVTQVRSTPSLWTYRSVMTNGTVGIMKSGIVYQTTNDRIMSVCRQRVIVETGKKPFKYILTATLQVLITALFPALLALDSLIMEQTEQGAALQARIML